MSLYKARSDYGRFTNRATHDMKGVKRPIVTIGYAVSYRRSFETIALSRIVVEILCVKHLTKHIPIENAHFCVLRGKTGVTAFCNFMLVAAPKARRLSSQSHSRSTGLVTAVFGPFH